MRQVLPGGIPVNVIFDIVKKGFDFPCHALGGCLFAPRIGAGGACLTARPREIKSLQLVFPMREPLIADH
jgi:hypothetical protein